MHLFQIVFCQVFFVDALSLFGIHNVNADGTPTTLETEVGLGITECPQDCLFVGNVGYIAVINVNLLAKTTVNKNIFVLPVFF